MTKHYKIIAFIIVLAALFLAITSVWDDSPIVDEIPHIGSGYSYVIKGDYRLNPEHPPLAKDLAGIALKFLSLKQGVFDTQYWNEDLNGQWNFGRNLIFNSGNDAIKIAHAAKIPIFIFFIISAVLIFIWAKDLDGPMSALIALFLFAFSPTVMAHSRFVTTDVPALFGVLLASYFFIKFLKNPSHKHLLIAGLAFGVAQLTKFSLFLFVPYFGLLALIYGWMHHAYGHKLKHAIHYGFLSVAVMIMGFVTVVWPVYALHTMNYPPLRQKSDTTRLLESYGNRKFADRVIWLSDKPFLRPLAQYGLGLLLVNQRSIGGNTTYFLGEVSKHAWKKYFPVVYFIKEPLAFWFLVAIVIGFLLTKFRKLGSGIEYWFRTNFDKFAMLLWLAIYWIVSIRANLNIGVRHLMPVYGFTYILVSSSIVSTYEHLQLVWKKWFLVVLIAIFGWYLAENLMIYPYYLTYFNQVAGGPSGGHNYVVDSNLDWGQDAKRLAEWLKANNVQEKVYLDYFGWSDQSYYYPDKYVGLSAGKFKSLQDFFKENSQGGWMAVSVSFYMGSRGDVANNYVWLDSVKPTAVIGNSIFIWHLMP